MVLAKRIAKALIPNRYHGRLRCWLDAVRLLRCPHFCSCCGNYIRRFGTFGMSPRPGALCPVCGFLERHRLICLYLRQRTDLLDGRRKRVLHVAPEPQLSPVFQKAEYLDYVSADLCNPIAMVKMDVTSIPFAADTFDVICCIHVLEHVPQDSQAMTELHRVLQPGGWAVLQVPIRRLLTHEDPSLGTPEERQKAFGQHDHVRIYGRDYRNRLEGAGFSVAVDPFARQLGDRAIRRFGLEPNDDVYFCRKGRV